MHYAGNCRETGGDFSVDPFRVGWRVGLRGICEVDTVEARDCDGQGELQGSESSAGYEAIDPAVMPVLVNVLALRWTHGVT